MLNNILLGRGILDKLCFFNIDSSFTVYWLNKLIFISMFPSNFFIFIERFQISGKWHEE